MIQYLATLYNMLDDDRSYADGRQIENRISYWKHSAFDISFLLRPSFCACICDISFKFTNTIWEFHQIINLCCGFAHCTGWLWSRNQHLYAWSWFISLFFNSIAILMPLWTVSLVIFVFVNEFAMRVLWHLQNY